MATIQNERDLILQATDPRFILPPLPPELQETVDAVKGITLSAPSTQFRIPQSGPAAPSSIPISAKLNIITGTITWTVVAGTATLTGSGSTRTLTAANMDTDLVTIRASVTYQSVTYFDDITIVKTYDGAAGDDGADGAPGVRGTVMLTTTISGSTWSDALANSAITNNTGSSLRVVGDVVTQVNNAAAYAQSRRWNGAAWIILAHMFSGDVIVEKTLSANRIVGGSFVGEEFTGGLFQGAVIRGSQEISVVDGGTLTVRDSLGNLKIGYDGPTGVWYFLAAVHIQSPVNFSNVASLLINCGIEGDVGNTIMMTGRAFTVDLGNGPQTMTIGSRV